MIRFVWDWYLVPGFWAVLLILLTEVIRSFSVILKQPGVLLILAIRLITNYPTWPVFLLRTLWLYVGHGETLVSSDSQKMDALRDKIKNGLHPLRRFWVSSEGLPGEFIHGYFSEYLNKDQILESRATHLIIVSPDQIKTYRFVSDTDLPMLFQKPFTKLSEARIACIGDTEWLDLCAPAREYQKWDYYQKFLERNNHELDF